MIHLNTSKQKLDHLDASNRDHSTQQRQMTQEAPCYAAVQPWPSMAGNRESVSQGWVEICASRKACIELDDEIFKVVRTSVHFLLSLSQSQFYFRLLTVPHKPEAMQKPSQNLMSSLFCLRVRTVKCRDACQCLGTVMVLDL